MNREEIIQALGSSKLYGIEIKNLDSVKRNYFLFYLYKGTVPVSKNKEV